jgi:hypothetical protein
VGGKPTIVLNPATDREFARAVSEALNGGLLEPEALQQSLRSAYPSAVVRRRELDDELIEIWYVYREGRWVPGD